MASNANSPQYTGKRALITGAAGGFGNAITARLLESGAAVVALDICKETLDNLKQKYPKVETIVADLSNWNETKEMVKASLPIDLLVNNAGVAKLTSLSHINSDDFDRTFAINVKSQFNLCQIVSEDLKQRQVSGAIVNVSSLASKLGSPGGALYCSSKGAIDSLTRQLAVELGPDNIRVNSVNPVYSKTGMTKEMFANPNLINNFLLRRQALKRVVEPVDVANAVAFLLSDEAKMITGVSLPIDGGFSLS